MLNSGYIYIYIYITILAPMSMNQQIEDSIKMWEVWQQREEGEMGVQA